MSADRESLVVVKTGAHLVPPQFSECVAKVFDFGAKKYSAYNWMKGLSFASTIGSMLRHSYALLRGEEYDSESGLPHECHVAANAAFLNWYLHSRMNGEYRDKFEDRAFGKN